MLIGAHVSTAGGLANAVERGTERGCKSIQIFNQSPRMWQPTNYGDEDFAAFREAMAASEIKVVIIHAVYLINCATEESELREKSLTALTHALRIGDAIGARGVVLHPGTVKGHKGEAPPAAIKRIGKVASEAIKQTDSCPLLYEDTAGAGGTVGRSFDELARLIEATGSGERVGICLDSCHLLASGHDIRTAEGLEQVLEDCDRVVGLDRLGALHVNDSKTPLGSNRDRHENLGEGELGREACARFLSEPRFEGLVACLEVPGSDEKRGPGAVDVALANKLREEGLAARGI